MTLFIELERTVELIIIAECLESSSCHLRCMSVPKVTSKDPAKKSAAADHLVLRTVITN